jgi:hypothetical protein
MTFTWLNKQGVRSSDGFEVQCTSRYTIEYREGMFRKVIDVEPIVVGGQSGVGISRGVFERWDNASVRNSEAEQERLLRNFRAAMEFQGLVVQI